MIRLMTTGLAILALALVTAESADAQRRGERLYIWKEVTVDATQATATIDVSDARGAVRALRVRTPSEPLLLSNVKVTYSDGNEFNERRRINLLAGERTRPIDPRREDRFVDRLLLEINPRTGFKGDVRVQILAHQTRRGRRMSRTEAPKVANVATETARQSILETDPRSGQGEVLFGAQRVGLGLDRDVIRVPDKIGRFGRIRFRVMENPVLIKAVTVVYDRGRPEDISGEIDLKLNTASPWMRIDPNRFIEEIRLSYEARSDFKGRARVEVFGNFADDWLGKDGKGRRHNDGWVLLGAQTAGFVGFDNDVVPVGRNLGGFRDIRVRVRDRAISLDEIRISYADGTSDTVPVRSRVDAGSNWGPFSLPGESRPIREVRARYRSRFFDRAAAGKGAAIVEVWGRY